MAAGLERVDVAGRDVLEIGGRSGKMAAYLAHLGGRVTTIDFDESIVPSARVEAARFDVGVKAWVDPGDLSSVPNEAVDVVFTKSVLVTVPDLAIYLDRFACKVRSSGRLVAIEKSQGSLLLTPLRMGRHGRLAVRRFDLFNEAHWQVVAERFDPIYRRHSTIPPIDLFVGIRS